MCHDLLKIFCHALPRHQTFDFGIIPDKPSTDFGAFSCYSNQGIHPGPSCSCAIRTQSAILTGQSMLASFTTTTLYNPTLVT